MVGERRRRKVSKARCERYIHRCGRLPDTRGLVVRWDRNVARSRTASELNTCALVLCRRSSVVCAKYIGEPGGRGASAAGAGGRQRGLRARRGVPAADGGGQQERRVRPHQADGRALHGLHVRTNTIERAACLSAGSGSLFFFPQGCRSQEG